MRKLVPAVAVLLATVAVSLGATRIEVSARLIGYDLAQVTGSSSLVTELPRIVVRSGSEGLIELAREYRYPKEFNAKGKPTVIRVAYLGVRMPVYLRENEGTVAFLVRVELCERENPSDPLSAILKTTTSFSGQAQFDKAVTISVGAPGKKLATLEMTMTRR